MLLQAKDFPKDAPVLLITDGMIEDDLVVRREHAYLLPRGWSFNAHGRTPHRLLKTL